jgi:hypothetical protein
VVSDSNLDNQHFLELSLIGFNGTRRAFQTATAAGVVRLEFVSNGSTTAAFNLTPPLLYFQSDRPHRPSHEFTVGIRLFLNDAQVEEYRTRQAAGETPRVMFSELTVVFETSRGRQCVLPLWSGVSLRPGQGSGRVFSLEVQSVLSASAS